MSQNQTILFVCEHGAAKIVIAAAYFNKLALESNSTLRAVARGTNPDDELSSNTINGLHTDGLTPTESKPQKLSLADLESSQRIISFCELPKEFQDRIPIEQWDNVPPVSENYKKARDAILDHLKHLIPNPPR